MQRKTKTMGFSLLELMIVLTIIAILAAVTIPNYQLYVKKAKFSEVITHVTPYKAGVEICAQLLGGLGDTKKNCGSSGQNEIPPDFIADDAAKNYVASIKTSFQSPEVLITAFSQGLGENYSYILRATDHEGQINWALDPASTCLKASVCHGV